MNTLPSLVLGAILLCAATAQGEFTYTTNSDGTGITITAYSGPNTVDIPSTINGLTVADIGETAFGNADITSVIIPTGVTNIGVAAFGNCEDLTNVDLPDYSY